MAFQLIEIALSAEIDWDFQPAADHFNRDLFAMKIVEDRIEAIP